MKICIFIEDLPGGGVEIKSIRQDLTPGDENRTANKIATILENNLNELQRNLNKAPLKRAAPWKAQARGDDETKALQAARSKKSCLH